MLFNLVPIEIVMMLNLAQQNFPVFVAVGLIIIAAELLLFIRVKIKKIVLEQRTKFTNLTKYSSEDVPLQLQLFA